MQKVLSILMGGMLMVLLFSCQKNMDLPDPAPNEHPIFSSMVQASVSGFVKDQNGSFITDATVIWGDATTTTDIHGYFKVTSSVSKNKAVLTVQKNNYFKAIQTLHAFQNETIKTEVQMIDRRLSGTIVASTGGEINLPNGAKIQFQRSSFETTNGEAYHGTVKVFAYFLNPTVPNLNAIMPGNLLALNTLQEPQILQSYGMMNVELEGSMGEKLNIRKSATLEMPIPFSMEKNAPSSLPLWYFDETSGLWIEEGQATLKGNAYQGEVEHFTWWNCDVPFNFIELSGNLEAVDYLPIVNIKITELTTGFIGTATSSTNGSFSGFVPKNQPFLFEIVDLCGETIFSEEIGPFTEDTNIGTITIEFSSEKYGEISGTAQNCSQQPITNGYVLISSSTNDEIYAAIDLDENGNFSDVITFCDESNLLLQVIDFDSLKTGIPTSFATSSFMDIGIILGCENELEGLLVLEFDGQTVQMTPCSVKDFPLPGQTAYQVEAHHQSDGAIVHYGIRIREEPSNSFLDALVYTTSTVCVLGEPEIIYSLSADNYTVSSLSTSSEEYLIFTSNNVTVKNGATILSEMGHLTISAKVE